MGERPENPEKTAEAAPPSYEDIQPLPCQIQRQPGPATGGKFYREDEQPPSISFTFCPDPSKSPVDRGWAALLSVKCRDVPRLMREGFYWDDANVIREEGYVDQDFTSHYQRTNYQQNNIKWSGNRHYFLKDLQQPPLWIATIELFAVNNETLYRFDLNRLSRENMRIAEANCQSGSSIYCWHYGIPKMSFNAVYDDTPMEGWWPWPRKN